MSQTENLSDRIGRSLTTWVLDNKWKAVTLSFILFFGLATGMKNLSMTTDYRYFFGKDNPQRIAFEQLQNVYSKDDSVLFVIQPKEGKVFNKKTLKAIVELTEKSWKVPYSTRVDSITNFQYTKAIEDDLIVKDLVRAEEIEGLTPEILIEIENIVQTEPLLKDRIISPNSQVTALNIRVELPGKSPMEVPEIAAYVRELAKDFRQKYPDHEVYLSGIAMMNNAFNEAGMNDMMTLTPIMYGVIILIMFLMLKTFWAVVATLIVVFLSMFSGLGFGGWIGIPISPPSSVAPTVILTLAIADSIHILKTILENMAAGMEKGKAIIHSMRVNFQPVFLTSLTTVIGFLTLNFSDTPPFHDLGNMTAAGVTAAFLFSIVLLPALVAIFPVKAKLKTQEQKSSRLANFGGAVVRHRYPVLIAIFALSGLLFSQIPNIKLNDQFIGYFDESIEFRRHADYVMENLTGIYLVHYDLKSNEAQGIAEPKFLKKVDDFSNYLRTIPNVVHVNSITDTFKRLNKNMHADDLSFYSLPDNRELASQYLLLYEMSLPYGLDLNNQINIDKSSTRVTLTMGNVETTQMLDINSKAEGWLKDNAPEMETMGTSPAIMFAHITERNVKGMTKGTILAFILITLTLIFAIGSLKYGLVSLLPNMIPVGLAFGVWSLIVGEAGFAIAIVGSVTLGIVVDDTVHFLSKYARARRELGYDSEQAVRYAFENVGPALIITTVVLVCGFSVLMLSPFKMNVILGALSAMTIGIALIVDFVLLPAILPVIDGLGKKNKKRSNEMRKIVNAGIIGLIAFAIGTFSNPAQAKGKEMKVNKGLEIAKKIDERENGFINQVATVEMVLQNKQGQKSIRKMRIKTLEVKNDGDKSLTIFDSPKDYKGTAFLSFTHSKGPDDQWLYLSALKRVKRISSNNKSGPFLGSEFAFEDIASQEVDKYTYKYIKKEKVVGGAGHIIERYPTDKKSGYTKQVVWVDGTEWRVHKIDFYDRKGAKLKTLEFQNYKKYPNGKWRPGVMAMVNHQSGKSTQLRWKEYKFNQNISEKDFNQNALKRVR